MSVTVDTPQPSPSEVLLATYGDEWDIWREMKPDGSHGDWLAEHLVKGTPSQLRASSVEALAELLRETRP